MFLYLCLVDWFDSMILDRLIREEQNDSRIMLLIFITHTHSHKHIQKQQLNSDNNVQNDTVSFHSTSA